MKKNIKKIFTMMILLMVFTTNNQVNAVESGGSIGGVGGSSVGSSDGQTSGHFVVNKSAGYRVSIVKYKTGSKEKPETVVSKTFLFDGFVKEHIRTGKCNVGGTAVLKYSKSVPKTAINEGFNEKSGNWKDGSECIPNVTGYSSKNPTPVSGKDYIVDSSYNVNNYVEGGEFKFVYDDVVKYFKDLAKTDNTAKLQNYLEKTFGYSLKENPNLCADLLYSYILVEPMAIVANGYSFGNANYFFGTATELSAVYGGSWVNTYLSKGIYTPTVNFGMKNGKSLKFDYFTDGGINNVENGLNTSGTTSIISTNSYGVGTLWIGHLYDRCQTCYKKTVENKTGSLKCEKTNENNVMDFTEKYDITPCENQEKEEESNTQYGRKIYETDNTGNCAVYCIESAKTSFPGHLASAQDLDAVNGAYFTWPSKIGTDGMKMFMNLKYTCRIIQKNGKKCSENDITNIKRAVSSNLDQIKMSASLEAGDNKKINESLIPYYSFDEKGIITNLLDDNDKEVTKISFNSEGVSNRIVMSKKLYYKIPDNKNRLYNKETDRVFDGNQAATGIFDRGKGVVSLSRNLDVNKKYNLIIKNVDLGTADQFGKLIDKTGYVCTYTVMKTPPCRCPAGTLNEDDPLYEELTKDKSCAELIATKCDICKCPPDSLYPNKVLAVGNDVTTKACQENVDKECYKTCKKFKGTIREEELKGQELIDFNKCIEENVKNGSTKEEAYNVCDAKYCSYCITPAGTTMNLYESVCMKEELKSYEECYPKYCSIKTDCPPGTCCNCNWIMNKTKTKIEYEKICKTSPEDGCGYVSLTCPNPNEEFAEDPLKCVEKTLKGKLNGKTVLQALDSLTISEDDLRYAVNACKPTACSGDISEGKIIYRQIDLNDPFPGKTWAGTNKLIDASNNSINKKNRTPGENWNSKTFIDSKILNARGAKGYNLYYEKNPLYIIKLTPETIKKIRTYNKENKYDDFKLDCKTANGGAACISNFLHTRGTIKNLNYDDFILKSYVENNVEKNSVRACYSMNYSEAGFNACYNAKN